MSIHNFAFFRRLMLALSITSLAVVAVAHGAFRLPFSGFASDRQTSTSTVKLPDPSLNIPISQANGTQTVVFAGGCFWGVEAVFEHVKGVKDVVSGFAGGSATTANYNAVSFGITDHAEAVKITYDPSQISYNQLLKIYFAIAHDPTQLNRQGPDSGTQYRSAIFFANEAQKQVAQAYIEQLNKANVFNQPIVTQLTHLNGFYAAEEYHQDFIDRNPNHPYVVIHDLPKLAHLQKQFPNLYK